MLQKKRIKKGKANLSLQGRCTMATTGKNMREWRRLAADRKVRRMAAKCQHTQDPPVAHFTPA